MPELTVVIPFCNEYPMIEVTLRSLANELAAAKIDFEIIAVDNWMEEVGEQISTKTGRCFGKDRGHEIVSSMATVLPWLRVIRYDKKLSHWNAKMAAVAESDSPFLYFCDAHVMPHPGALGRMIWYYTSSPKLHKTSSFHLPLTYHILDEKRLIYRLRWRPEFHDLDYTFCSPPDRPVCYEVPCMSTCGMLISRKALEKTGGWPSELGIYGGGEHFMNYVMAVLGMKKFIFGDDPLYHHGAERGYRWNAYDYERNRMIAAFLFGGAEFAEQHSRKRDPKSFPNRRILQHLRTEVVNNDSLCELRDRIQDATVVDIYDFIVRWDGKQT